MKTWTKDELLKLTPGQVEGTRWNNSVGVSIHFVVVRCRVDYSQPGIGPCKWTAFHHLVNAFPSRLFPCDENGQPIDWTPPKTPDTEEVDHVGEPRPLEGVGTKLLNDELSEFIDATDKAREAMRNRFIAATVEIIDPTTYSRAVAAFDTLYPRPRSS